MFNFCKKGVVLLNESIVYIGEKVGEGNHAGNKARADIDNILNKRYGESYINIEQYAYNDLYHKIKHYAGMIVQYIYIYILNNRFVIIQYPFYYKSMLKRVLNRMLLKNRVAVIIHDVDSLRNSGDKNLEDEVALLNRAEVIIVHNLKMKKKLVDCGLKAKCIVLGLFDYLLEDVPKDNRTLGKEIVFAGNLSKSSFLKTERFSLLNINFNLYGPNYDAGNISSRNTKYLGSFRPDAIPYVLKGNFGLIWDGNSTETCSGDVGYYMKYNNPHKLSLYIAAGLPVIVWREAAIAEFVEKEGIGILVNNLDEIEKRIDSLDSKDYLMLLNNIDRIKSKVLKGSFTMEALIEAEKLLNW